jgi:hypothetical protein
MANLFVPRQHPTQQHGVKRRVLELHFDDSSAEIIKLYEDGPLYRTVLYGDCDNCGCSYPQKELRRVILGGNWLCLDCRGRC